MFLRQHHRRKDGKEHRYWSLVETVRTPDGPRQRTICYLGELNEGREIWLRRITKREEDQESLLNQLRLELPERLEPIQILKCSADSAIT